MSDFYIDAFIKINKKNQVIKYDKIELNKGDFVILDGPNGAGKSTFFDLILFNKKNFTEIDKTKYIFDGKEISGNDYDGEIKRKITYMSQEDFFGNRSIYEALELKTLNTFEDFTHDVRKAKRLETQKLINYYNEKYLKKFLYEKNNKNSNLHLRSAQKLSGGQQKLISFLSSIIRCEVTKSKILLLDEPLNNLDKENKKIVNNLIQDLRSNNNDLIIILITHCKVIFGLNKCIKLHKKSDEKFISETYDYKNQPYQCLYEGEIINGYYPIKKFDL